MVESRAARLLLRAATLLVLAFIYAPIAILTLYAFNESRIQAWPIKGFTLEWFSRAVDNPGLRDALWLSLKAAAGATLVAMVLGTLASLAVARFRFFGRETISFLVILPIALPGIVTGMALNATFREVLDPFGIGFGLFTVIVGHATFCIVVVYNNTVARLRRTQASLEEASADLGADTWQTFRHVTFPQLRTALLAGGLLAFALSFDEVIVTTFTAGPDQTLPIWILNNISRPNQLPIVNDLLLASHVDSGKLPVHVDRFDVVEVARGVVETARTFAPEQVDLRFTAAKRVPPIAADPDHVRQVLRNLLENAVKYSPEGGRVTVRVAAADDKVRLSVADEGLGIPASEQRRIFEKFYRSDPDMTLGIGGTGLGLYISRELVRRVGGRIHVESNGRKGSTFVVELPAAARAAAGAAS